MFVLKSFEKLIRDCNEVYQKLHFEILNNGDVKVWMFEQFKDCPDIIPCDCIRDLKTFKDVLFFQGLMDTSESEDMIKIIDDFIEEVFNEHHKLFANYKFSEGDVIGKYINGEAKKNARDLENTIDVIMFERVKKGKITKDEYSKWLFNH